MLITSEIGYVGHRKITFLSELLQFFFNEKNAFPIIYREDESCPCYHFCSFLPRGQKPYRVRFHPDFPIQSGRSVTVLIPFRYNRRSCCSLNVNLISPAPLPSHLPSAPALPSQPPESNDSFSFCAILLLIA